MRGERTSSVWRPAEEYVSLLPLLRAVVFNHAQLVRSFFHSFGCLFFTIPFFFSKKVASALEAVRARGRK
jgi:hypothetical protein